ncbi:MAG: hypothetical protein IPK16_21800 [Anaerolineales bacterium]|nr:hypothetical protein [Anaerolineales bacterium]
MPPEIEDVFAQAGATLLPSGDGELTHTCSACPSGASPCRPVAAVYYQLGEMVAEDPWLLLRLRGRDRQQLLAAVHEQRNAQASSEGPTRPQRTVPAETRVDTFYQPQATVSEANATDPSLELQIEDFWGRRKVLEQVHHHLTRPAVELALLRRLGPPTPSPDGAEAFVQLQQIYRRVTDRVWALAFAPEEELETGGEEGGA